MQLWPITYTSTCAVTCVHTNQVQYVYWNEHPGHGIGGVARLDPQWNGDLEPKWSIIYKCKPFHPPASLCSKLCCTMLHFWVKIKPLPHPAPALLHTHDRQPFLPVRKRVSVISFIFTVPLHLCSQGNGHFTLALANRKSPGVCWGALGRSRNKCVYLFRI